jgi:ABC-2 type transport system ATP-binding protein
MRQRLGIAAALTTDPSIVLLDEPTSALDPVGRKELLDIVSMLKSENKVVILSTHILTDMESVCDMVGFLHNGVITKNVNLKKSEDTLQSYIVRVNSGISQIKDFTNINIEFLDENTMKIDLNTNDIIQSQSEMFDFLSKQQIQIDNVKKVQRSLDDIFMEVLAE